MGNSFYFFFLATFHHSYQAGKLRLTAIEHEKRRADIPENTFSPSQNILFKFSAYTMVWKQDALDLQKAGTWNLMLDLIYFGRYGAGFSFSLFN